MDVAHELYRAMIRRVILTMLIMTAALVGSLIYVGFYSSNFSIFQKIVIVLVTLIISGFVVAILWMLGWSKYMNKKTFQKFKNWK